MANNIFKELGFEDASERLLKADLSYKIFKSANENFIEPIELGSILGITLKDAKKLCNYEQHEFCINELREFISVIKDWFCIEARVSA